MLSLLLTTQLRRIHANVCLRYLAQVAISKAQQERDFSEVDRLLSLLSCPYDEQAEMEIYAAPAPEWARKIEVSCSS